jgi:hypothetical protein
MQFRLHYRGPLHSNATPARLQQIRRQLHPQLATLWDSPSLKWRKEEDWCHPTRRDIWFRPIKSFEFVPLVNDKMNSIAALQLTLLRPGELGSLVSASGDIDNRLKTLFDALRVPSADQVRDFDSPSADEMPFFCVLDDDALITEVDVVTDRLLEPGADLNLVELIIAVKIRSRHEGFGGQWG